VCSVPRGSRGASITSPAPLPWRATSPSRRWARSACWRGRTGSTTGGGKHAARGGGGGRLIKRPPRLPTRAPCRLGWRSRRRFGLRRRFLAAVFPPGLLGQLRLAAYRDVIVAVGNLGYDRTCDAGLGLRHQALQFGRAGREDLALRLELLAIVEVIF